jgi:hypothetical protein
VTETTGLGRLVRKSPRLYGWLTARGGRFLLIVAAAVLILGAIIGGRIYGWYLESRDLQARDNTIQQLRSDVQKLLAEITDENAKFAALQTKLASVQAALDALMPAKNTYNLSSNQSLIVAGGHLTIGLIGSPTNEGVNININGKQQLAAAGDVVHVAVDPSTNCQVRVQSFDMFKAVVTASCAAAKPQ